jgi:hypothetical protein
MPAALACRSQTKHPTLYDLGLAGPASTAHVFALDCPGRYSWAPPCQQVRLLCSIEAGAALCRRLMQQWPLHCIGCTRCTRLWLLTVSRPPGTCCMGACRVSGHPRAAGEDGTYGPGARGCFCAGTPLSRPLSPTSTGSQHTLGPQCCACTPAHAENRRRCRQGSLRLAGPHAGCRGLTALLHSADGGGQGVACQKWRLPWPPLPVCCARVLPCSVPCCPGLCCCCMLHWGLSGSRQHVSDPYSFIPPAGPRARQYRPVACDPAGV